MKSRDTQWAKAIAAALARAGASPNGISQASIVFAAIAGLCFWCSTWLSMGAWWLLLAALFIQLRLLANLFDGMVAIEGGKSSADGAFWNEIPDRWADTLILIGAGVAVEEPTLGFAAAAAAIFTAYVREFGRAEGLEADFRGPLAKPHRMAVTTAGAVLAAIEIATLGSRFALLVALWIVCVGTVLTVVRRSVRIVRQFDGRGG